MAEYLHKDSLEPLKQNDEELTLRTSGHQQHVRKNTSQLLSTGEETLHAPWEQSLTVLYFQRGVLILCLVLGLGTCVWLSTFGCLGTCQATVHLGSSSYQYHVPDHQGGALIVANTFLPDSTNLWFSNTVAGFQASQALWGSPVVVKPDGTVFPDELTEVPTQANGDVSSDGRVVTLHLRHDLRWSDGQPLTADDFVYWLKVLLDPATGPATTYGFDKIVSFRANDAFTLALTYRQVYSAYLFFLPLAAPRHAWGLISHKMLFTTKEVNLTPHVTSGPFEVANYASQQSLTLTPNRYYVSTTLHRTVLDRLIFRVFPSSAALIEGYHAGEIDHAEGFTIGDLQKMYGLSGRHVDRAIGYEHLDFNLSNPVLQNLHVRRAIAAAIDRCQLIQVLLNQSCDQWRIDTVLPSPALDSDASLQTAPANLARAKEEMQAAGYDCSSGICRQAGQPFPTLNLVTTNNSVLRIQVTELIRQDLAALGIQVRVEGNYYPPNVFFTDYRSGGILARGQFDLALFGYDLYFDPDTNLYVDFHSSQIPRDSYPAGLNYERVADSQLDILLDEGRTTLDTSRLAVIYKQVQELINSDVYTILLYARPNITLTNPNIGNYFASPAFFPGNFWNVGEWYLRVS